jgi:hypothetical protein
MARFFENFFSCDLQRLFMYNVAAKHVIAFISAFFLITLVDQNASNAKNIGELFATTFKIYALYIMSTKAKAYFVLPMIIVLFVDQILKIQIDIMERKEGMEDKPKTAAGEQSKTAAGEQSKTAAGEQSKTAAGDFAAKIDAKMNKKDRIDLLKRIREYLTYVIVTLIVVGVLHYYVRARLEFQDQFSHSAFFFGTRKCANLENNGA